VSACHRLIFRTRIIHSSWRCRRAPQARTLTIGEPFDGDVAEPPPASLALPVILWQAWAFFMPAIEPAHERMMRLFVVLLMVLFLFEIIFTY
jgi:hypothetical protein